MPNVIHWEIWITALDRKVCSNCARLQGTLHLSTEGPRPPLHNHCRCYRRYHHSETLPDIPPPPTPPPHTPVPPNTPYKPQPPQPMPLPFPIPIIRPFPIYPLPPEEEEEEEPRDE